MNGLQNISDPADLRKKLRGMILNGVIPPGSRLPGARTLGRKCGLHYQTVNRIYHELAERGLVETRQGHGTVVLYPDLSLIRILVLVEKVFDNERSHSYYHQEFVQGLEEKRAALGIQLEFAELGRDESSPVYDRFLRKSEDYDGIILLYSFSSDISDVLFNCKIPLVAYMTNDSMPFSTVTADTVGTTYMATRLLIEKGCRKIGLVVRNLENPNIQRKLLGYVSAMRDSGLNIEPDFIWELTGKSQFFNVVQQIGDHLKNHRLLDGYVCTGSNEGIILSSCLRRDGVKIPEQAMIVGYDEVEGGDDITRVVLPRRPCAHRCIEWILEHLGTPVMGEKILIPATLHIGNTTTKNGGKKCYAS